MSGVEILAALGAGSATTAAYTSVVAALPSLATVGTVASLGGAAMGVMGAQSTAKASARDAQFQADQAMREGKRAEAEAQQSSLEQIRRGKIARSNALAQAGASGFETTSKDFEDIFADIEAETEFRSMSDLYAGSERARTLYTQAGISRQQGREALSQGATNSFGVLAKTGTSLFDKYADKR